MDLTLVNEIWRPIYGKLVRGIALLTDEWKTLLRLTNFDQLSPRSITWPVELINGGGMAWTSNGGSTARATSNRPVEATDTWKHLAGRFEIGYDELDAENSAKFASAQIEKQMRYQAADKLRSFRRAIAIGFYGYPDAVLFEATGAGTDNGSTLTVPIANLYGHTGLTFGNIRDYITKGKDVVAFVNQGTGAISASGLVTAIDETNKTVTIQTTASSVNVGDGLVLYNQVLQDGATDLDQGINGLLHIGLSQVLHGISEIDQPDWVPGVRDMNTGAALDGTTLFKDFSAIEKRSDYRPTFCWTTDGVIAAAGGQQLDQRRYGADEDTMRLGFQKLNVMGVIAEGRPYCPPKMAFYGNPKALRKLSPDEAGPRDVVDTGDKRGGFKQYEDRLGFYKDQVMRAQLTVVSRLAFGIRGNITEA